MTWEWNAEQDCWDYDQESEEAGAYREFATSHVTYRSVLEARQHFLYVDRTLDWMQHNLSGCDWCCGGGEEDQSELSTEWRHAKAWLEARGESTDVVPACQMCFYADGAVVPDWNNPWYQLLCERCEPVARHRHEEQRMEA